MLIRVNYFLVGLLYSECKRRQKQILFFKQAKAVFLGLEANAEENTLPASEEGRRKHSSRIVYDTVQ
jgi:hypothetical protein